MKFFESIKQAAFSVKLFAAAGLTDLFATAFAANNADALKDHLATLAQGKASADVEAALAEATKENETLAAKVKEIEAANNEAVAALAEASSLRNALSAAGVDLAKVTFKQGDAAANAAAVKTALEARISVKAQEQLARTGSAPLEETPASGAAEPKKPAAKLTGRARVEAAFKAQAAAKKA